MNYELTLGGRVTQREHGHLWGTDASTLPLLLTVHKQDQQIVTPSSLLDSNTMLCRTTQEMCETQTFASPRCFSFTVALPSPPVNHPEWHVDLSYPISQRWQAALPAFYPVIWLCRGLVLAALLLITELGERATPTHWLICSSAQHAGTLLVKMWRTDAYSLFFCGFTPTSCSYIYFLLIWIYCLLASCGNRHWVTLSIHFLKLYI